MKKNIKLYPWYYASSSFLAWLPIFFLYFSQFLNLQEVLLLEAVYYISVVLLEVPTGYFSDLVGRRKTLLLGSMFLCLACIAFIIGGHFIVLVIGQLLFALFMSFTSGTNTVLHYESLLEEGRESEYGDREAIANKYGMIAGGTGALIGGAVGIIDLRLAYVITLFTAVASLWLIYQMNEPKGKTTSGRAKENMLAQIRISIQYLKVKPLGWLAAYFVLFFTITHVPYEFYQPYIQILEGEEMIWNSSTPILSGILYACARYLGAFGAAYSMTWKRALGLRNHLLLQLAIINVIVWIMSLFLHPLIILVVLMRSLPWAAIKAPVNELITPIVEAGQRATFHSILSLLCRLSFFIVLFVLSFAVPDDGDISWNNLKLLLSICFVGGAVMSGIISLRYKSSNLD